MSGGLVVRLPFDPGVELVPVDAGAVSHGNAERLAAYRNFCGAYNRGPALWEQACRPVIFVAWKMMRPPVVGWMA